MRAPARYDDFLSKPAAAISDKSEPRLIRNSPVSALAKLLSPAVQRCSGARRERSGHMWILMSRATRRRYWLLVAIVCAAAAILMSAMQGSAAAESLASAGAPR